VYHCWVVSSWNYYDLEIAHHSWSSQLVPFERFLTVFCQCSIVTMTLSRIISRICLVVFRIYTNVTDKQTDGRTPHRHHTTSYVSLCTASSRNKSLMQTISSSLIACMILRSLVLSQYRNARCYCGGKYRLIYRWKMTFAAANTATIAAVNTAPFSVNKMTFAAVNKWWWSPPGGEHRITVHHYKQWKRKYIY